MREAGSRASSTTPRAAARPCSSSRWWRSSWATPGARHRPPSARRSNGSSTSSPPWSRPMPAQLRESLAALARFDLWSAKARLGAEMDGVRAETADRPEVVLLGARHPGLSGRVVPIDLRLGDGYTALVVTGPNTGGKTVTLRTLGLLALMHQAGPAHPGRDRVAPAGLRGRVRRHRRRAVRRPEPLDVLGPPALDHPDRRGGGSRHAGPARRARRRDRSDRGLGAGPGAARPLHPGRRARGGDDPLRRAEGVRPHDARRPQRLGRVRPRDASARPTGSRSACPVAARPSRSPSGWGCRGPSSRTPARG